MKIVRDVNGVTTEFELTTQELFDAHRAQEHIWDVNYIEGMFGLEERFDDMDEEEKKEVLDDIAWDYRERLNDAEVKDEFEIASEAFEKYFEVRESQKGINEMGKLEFIIGYAGAKEIIDGFRFSGDWEISQISLSNALQSYYYDDVGVYNDGIRNAIEDKVNRVIIEKYPDKKFIVGHDGLLYERVAGQTTDVELSWGSNDYVITKEIYEMGKDDPILHDEDLWMGKYHTYGEMWIGEGYKIEGLNFTREVELVEDVVAGSGRYVIEVTIDVVGGNGEELGFKLVGNDLEEMQAGILPAVQKACAEQGYLDNQVVVGILIEENGEWLDSDEETFDLSELNVWICSYKDSLGYIDNGDNVTDILVPKAWLIEKLKSEGEIDIEGWFDEYTADSTDMIARYAVSEGVVLSCADKRISCVLGLGESFLNTNDYGMRLAEHMREIYLAELDHQDYMYVGTNIVSDDKVNTAEDAAGWFLLTYGDKALSEVHEWIEEDVVDAFLGVDIQDVVNVLENCVVPVKDNSLTSRLAAASLRSNVEQGQEISAKGKGKESPEETI